MSRRVRVRTGGALGDGNGKDESSTHWVDAGVLARDVCTGEGHGCALLLDAGVECWGRAENGQLGHLKAPPPVSAAHVRPILRPVPVRSLSCGSSHSCAVLVDGTALCWGANERGQLGVGTQGASLNLPADVPLPSR